MAYSNSDEIFITMHSDDKEAFYAKIPYDKLPNIHRIGGKWMQSGKEWRFPLDDQIWEKFQKEFASEFATGKVHKDVAFLLAFDKRHKDLDKFLKFKEVAMRDEPTEFGVEGVSLNGKNCLFNYQRWGVQCGLTVGDGFLIGDSMGLGKCLALNNLCQFDSGMKKVGDVIRGIDNSKWYASDDRIGEWNDCIDLRMLGNKDGDSIMLPVKRVYREKVGRTGILVTQNGLRNEFGYNHRFFTNHGWKRLSELSSNDWILYENEMKSSSMTHYDNEDVYWLAWQISEGTDCRLEGCHVITNKDTGVLERIKRHLDSLHVKNAYGKDYEAYVHYEDNGMTRCSYLQFNHNLSYRLRDVFGYKLGTKSGDKEIPMSILNCDDENARLFIQCMWDAEGCCNKDNLEFSSKSYDIVEKMWYLLKRFGIFGVVRSRTAKVKDGRNQYWRINIGGIYARKFKDEIGFATSYKQDALERLCERTANTNIGYSSPCKEKLSSLVKDILNTSFHIVGLDSSKMKGMNEYSVEKVAGICKSIRFALKNGVYRKKSKWSSLEDSFNKNRIERMNEANAILEEMEKYYTGKFQWLKVNEVIEKNEESYVYDFEIDDDCHNYYASGMLTHNTIQGLGIAKERMNRGEVRNCLIVCPASLKYNWRDEISKFLNMDALVIGHKCKNAQDREKQWIATGYPFKIVNYETVARDLYCEPKKNDNRISCAKAVLNSFDMVVFDEIHMLKHHSSQRTLACRQFNAKYKVGLTGTPLDGRLEEIHSIFQILKPGLFVSKQKFMERYAEYDYFGAVKGYHHIKEVSDKIAPYYLRRLKEEVLKDLPPKIHKDMMVELSPKNMKAYKDLVKKKNEITENASAMELVMRARQFLDFPEILGLHNSSDKYAVFKELLDELVKENNHKVIIFSQYTNTLHWLMKNLESEYKNILVIDGSVDPEERQEICKKFNSDQKYRILIGSNAMSTGLNLQSADDVINYTADFSPAIMKQREDRAYRCGVTHTVTVYDFVCMDTVDERVRNILTRKQTVNNALLGENVDSFEVGDMSAMEILSCL